MRPEDTTEFQRFALHLAQHSGRALPEEVWHYTDAHGLIAILSSGKIWATQISCLNDILEQRYFGDLIHNVVRIRRSQNTDPDLEILLHAAEEGLEKRDFSTDAQFVACFSEVEDDLGQWRGYGGGECGYAIGFQSQGIQDAIKTRPFALLMPMN